MGSKAFAGDEGANVRPRAWWAGSEERRPADVEAERGQRGERAQRAAAVCVAHLYPRAFSGAMRHSEEPITMVVGASGVGIGPTVAERLAKDGHHLILVGRTQARLEQLQSNIEKEAASVRIQAGDATRPKRIRRFVDDALIHYGRIDNLVYVPAAGTFKPFLETSPSDLEEHLEVSLRGPWHWLQTLVPVMLEHGGGRLIFMSATAGKRGFPQMSAFSAAKFALHGLIESVAREHRGAGVQPVAVVLDGMLDHAGTRESHPEKEDWSDTISMEAVSDAVHALCAQHRRGMTHELWLTPGLERW